MVEIDHSTLPQPEPEPAIPILASHLHQLEQKQRTKFTRDGRPERLSTHCDDVDEILGGGAERGIVMGISSEGVEGRLISLHLLASILLSHLPLEPDQQPKTKATIIDTTGSFPLQLLARVLKSRITTTHALSTRTANQTANHPISKPTESRQPEDEAVVNKEVQQCLQMISITRVFDIEGLWEVLGEIGHDPPAPAPSKSPIPEIEKKTDGPIQSSPDWPSPEEVEINDSQETSFPSPIENNDYALIPPETPREIDEGIEIIIIDTMTQIINELFSRKERTDAHNLLTLLSRQIYSLSSTSNILTILHNTTTSSKPSSYPHSHSRQNQNNNNNYPQTRPQKPKSNPQPTSIFASNPLKPALGSLFSQFPSLHLFTSSLSKTREDAEILYARDRNQDGHGDGLPLPEGAVGYCCVVEVLVDEVPDLSSSGTQMKDGKGGGEEGQKEREKRGLGYREQRWCAVEIDSHGVGLKSAFGMRGGMKGMGLERRGIGRGILAADVREKGSTETEVGNVAKIWGFGGRRV